MCAQLQREAHTRRMIGRWVWSGGFTPNPLNGQTCQPHSLACTNVLLCQVMHIPAQGCKWPCARCGVRSSSTPACNRKPLLVEVGQELAREAEGWVHQWIVCSHSSATFSDTVISRALATFACASTAARSTRSTSTRSASMPRSSSCCSSTVVARALATLASPPTTAPSTRSTSVSCACSSCGSDTVVARALAMLAILVSALVLNRTFALSHAAGSHVRDRHDLIQCLWSGLASAAACAAVPQCGCPLSMQQPVPFDVHTVLVSYVSRDHSLTACSYLEHTLLANSYRMS